MLPLLPAEANRALAAYGPRQIDDPVADAITKYVKAKTKRGSRG
jgi:hypothetical protein